MEFDQSWLPYTDQGSAEASTWDELDLGGFPIVEFRPLTESDPDWKNFQSYKKQVFGDKEYDFVWYYNARNIRRKQPSDMFAAWNQFCETIGPEKSKKCCFLLHTQISDENGTNLGAVKDLLIDEEKHGDVVFWDHIVSPQEMNFLYNMSDLTSLLSSNEGWGLSLTEAMMCGKMIMATVTGGMQDQMRFTDEDGNWIEFDDNFCSNHFGTYKTHGEWAIPLYPACMSIQGSVTFLGSASFQGISPNTVTFAPNQGVTISSPSTGVPIDGVVISAPTGGDIADGTSSSTTSIFNSP